MKRNIYLVFSFTGTLLSRIIKRTTKDSYAHVSISLEDNFEKMYSFGRKHPSNPIWAGLVTENLFEGVFKNFKNSQCLVYKIEITEEQYNQLEIELNKFMGEQNKYRYNFAGLIALKFNKTLKRKYHYFCSQFVSELLHKSEILYLNKPPELTKPCELINIENKIFVFEGSIKDFNAFLKNKKINFENSDYINNTI